LVIVWVICIVKSSASFFFVVAAMRVVSLDLGDEGNSAQCVVAGLALDWQMIA